MHPGDVVMTDGVIAQMTHAKWEAIKARSAELEGAARVALEALRDAHEASVVRGSSVHWDVLEQRLREAHDVLSKTLS